MDPQSQSFTPYSSNNDTWRLQSDVARIQQVQHEHSERIARIERRQDEDARMKSVWGSNSPFPSVLSGGTPQQGTFVLKGYLYAAYTRSAAPLHQPPSDQFRNFDEDTGNLISSLHLDPEEEPRRGLTAASRANSVRFDETANQAHFSHSSRPSMDFMSRTSSGGIGGLQMTERSASHKSDGRASSVHSIRSAASGRANSLNLDTTYGVGDSNNPGLAPGLLLLGSVPAIIRCWMNMNFKHNALLYAAVCTGSYQSSLDLQLIRKLGFENIITTDDAGHRTIRLPVFFPEAIPHPASSRSSSPAPQLPTLTVTFNVVDHAQSEDDKAIQIFIGSDVLRAHNADILFSSNSMTLFDDDRSKLSIPLVRPEDESTFKCLSTTATTTQPTLQQAPESSQIQPFSNGAGQDSSAASVSSAAASPPPGKYRPPGALAASGPSSESARAGAPGSDSDTRPLSRQSTASRPSLTLLNTSSDAPDPSDSTSQPTAIRSGSSPATWGPWRRVDSNTTPSSAAAPDPSYQRKDTGMKVLKPKTAYRAVSSTATSSLGSPADGKSRFFDDGRRRTEGESKPATTPSAATQAATQAAAPAAPATQKTKSNPIGGGSAFTWLSGGGGGK